MGSVIISELEIIPEAPPQEEAPPPANTYATEPPTPPLQPADVREVVRFQEERELRVHAH